MASNDETPVVSSNQGSINKMSSATKCSLCNGYLSLGPIWLTTEYQIICGRCTVPNEDVKHRLTFYEEIANNSYFPCRYDAYGCNAKLLWNTVEIHESSCRFVQIECPEVSCSDKITLTKLEEHFKDKHAGNIIVENKISLDDSLYYSKSVYLFMFNKNAYIIQLYFSKYNCYFNILCTDEDNTDKFYDLVIKDEHITREINFKQLNIRKYDLGKKLDFRQMKKIVLNSFSVLYARIFFTFTISERRNSLSTSKLDHDILSNLECPVCYYYLMPPIYMCSTGHSICGKCKNELTDCPVCRNELTNSRNFSLEKIAEGVTYPCQYKQDGCDFIGKIQELTIHDKSCPGNYCCFLELCEWRGGIVNLIKHLKELHSDEYIHLGDRFEYKIDRTKVNKNVYYTFYDEEIFKINFVYSYQVGLKVHASHVKKVRKCEYKFTVCFTNDIEMMRLMEKCGAGILDIGQTIVKRFFQDNILILKFYITECQNN